MNRTYYVYKHTTPSNKVYIGITKQEPEKRWKYGNGYNKDSIFYNAVLKYGWDNINHEILYSGLTEEEACEKEIELIAEYKSTDRRYGYNISAGGNTTHNTIEANAKRRAKALERWSDPERRKSMSEKMTGKAHSKETREKMSLSQKKRYEDPAEREKVSKCQLGKTRTQEAKEKTSNSLKAFYSIPENAKRVADSQREANRRTHGRKVMCVETGKIYDTIVDASRECNIERRYISDMCRHKRKNVGVYSWQYCN